MRTDRLLLRSWLPEDVGFLFDLYSRWDVQRFIGREPRVMASREEAEQRLRRWAALDLPQPQGVWAVTQAGTGRRLGVLLLKGIPASAPDGSAPPSGDVEIGWHLHPDAWGHGHATEAARRVLRHAFEGGLDEVVAVTHPDNRASQRVCRRIGMTAEGLTDRYYDTTCAAFRLSRDAWTSAGGTAAADRSRPPGPRG